MMSATRDIRYRYLIACKSRRWDQRENHHLNTVSIAFICFSRTS